MLNVALHQQSRILKLSAGPRDLGLPTQIGHCVFRLKISETLIFSPLGRSHDSEIQKRSRVQPDRTPTPSTENRASPHCARPEQGQIFGDIGKSLPNWTERATETLRASSFGGTCRSVGIVSNPWDTSRVPVTANILDTRGKKQPKAYVPTLTPQPYRAITD
jgi:hypothetical protein